MVKYELLSSHTIQNAQDAKQITKLFYSFEINLDDVVYWAVVGMFIVLFVSIINWLPIPNVTCKYIFNDEKSMKHELEEFLFNHFNILLNI